MKRKDKQQFASMSIQELSNQLRDAKKQITDIALNKFTKPGKNVRAITALRLKVAVIKTRINSEKYTNESKEK